MTAVSPQKALLARLRAIGCVLIGALLLMSTAFAGGRPSVFFDTDGYYLMGENAAQAIKRLPAAFAGDPKAMTTPVSDDDQIDITVMGARSPAFGLFLFVLEKLGGVWLVAGVQALICAWTVYLLWKSAAPAAPQWTYLALMAGLTAGSTLPFFATMIMPDVFAGVAAAAFVALTVYGARLSRLETAGAVLVLAFAYAVHASHMLTALAAMVPAALLFWWFKAPAKPVVRGYALVFAAMVLAVLSGKAYDGAFALRTGTTLHRPPFLMARVLADGPGRAYLRKVCKGPDDPYVICRAKQAPLTRSDDILWEESPLIGAFNALKSPELQLRMEAEEWPFVKASVLNDPWGQFKASMENWADQLIRISVHDPLRDPRQFLANEYWKTTRLVDMIVAPEQCKPIGPGCKPPFDMAMTKHWHELVMILSTLFAAWRLSRPDVRAELSDRKAPWARDAIPLAVAVAILAGMVVLKAGVCGVISGAFSRYQARIVWLWPAAAGLIAIRLGLALPQRLRGRVHVRAA
ncbi:MAG: hypothetical protein ACXWKY_07985 [Caulobacteraceae bacterium]